MFVVLSGTTTYDLYLLVGLFFSLLQNPQVFFTNVRGTVARARSSTKTRTVVFIVGRVLQFISMTIVLLAVPPSIPRFAEFTSLCRIVVRPRKIIFMQNTCRIHIFKPRNKNKKMSPNVRFSRYSYISSAETTTLIRPFCKFSGNLSLMFSRALKNQDFFIVLLFQDYCYITLPSPRVILFSRHGN